jgi:hypothetical protein
MADAENNKNHESGTPAPSDPTGPPISPDTIARLRAAIASNPRQSTSVLVTALLTVCPALLTGPLLTLLGFGGLGPAAGQYSRLDLASYHSKPTILTRA